MGRRSGKKYVGMRSGDWWMVDGFMVDGCSDYFSKNQNCICDLKCLKRDADDLYRFCLEAPPAGNLFEIGIDFTDHTQICRGRKG